MKKLVLLVLLLVGCGFAGDRGYVWLNSQVREPMSATSQPVHFHVEQGETTDQIAQDLQAKGLIRSARVFVLYLRYTDPSAHLEAGDFVLDKHMTMTQIVDALGHAKIEQAAVTLPEGTTIALMAPEAEKAGFGKAQDYLAAAADLSWPHAFLKERPAGAPQNLEGFLFPDTYHLDRGASARDLVKRQLDRFDEQFTPELRAQAAQPTATRPAQTIYSIVTLASMVEREVDQDADRPVVCGIYYNRLARGMALQVDATVLYGLGKWKETVLQVDLARDTPYNTYLHRGLPPGPISNPSLPAIKGCIAPQKTDYLFYFADAKGVTHFARSLAEFQQQQRQFGVSGQ
jgi:peptidoglycan lytic transglycosylase G